MHAGVQSMSHTRGFGAVAVVYSTEGLFVNQGKLRIKFATKSPYRLSVSQVLELAQDERPALIP